METDKNLVDLVKLDRVAAILILVGTKYPRMDEVKFVEECL